MPPQPPLSSFTPEIRKAFEEYLDNRTESGTTLMNATRRAEYLRYLADPEQKIHEPDKVERKRLNSIKRRVIKEFCMDSRGQLLHIAQKKEDITKPQAFIYDAFDHIERIHAAGGHNGYKKMYQRVKKEVHGISRDDVQRLLEHCQICLVNRQNSTRAPLQPIVVTEVLDRLQADLIDMRTKPDGEYVWILHLKDHFSKFSMLYALKSKKASEIAYYIGLFVRHLGVPEILQCDNGREFKGALLVFLKKHNIKLINGRPRTPRTQGLVEQANAVVKDKLRKWQAANGIGAWADALIEICEAINNQTHESFPTGVTPSQLMFLRKPKIRNTRLTSPAEEEKAVLRQISVDDIHKECETVAIKKGKATILVSHHLFEKALGLIPIEKGEDEEDSDPENPLQFRPPPLESSPQLILSPVLPPNKRRKRLTSQAQGSKSTSSSSSSDSELSEYPSPTRFGSTNRHTPSTPPLPYAKSRLLPHRPSPHTSKNTQTKEKSPSDSISSSERDISPSLSPARSIPTEKDHPDVQDPASVPPLIDPRLIQEQANVTAQVQQFQEGVRTRMKKKYSRNHNVVTFEIDQVVTLRIPNEDRATTDNHRVLCMIKEIPHEGRHRIQTKFGILDRLYPTSELNVVPSVDQDTYRLDFQNASTHTIFLHAVVKKAGTSNKVAITCLCKKSCNPRSRCKCRKNKVKCSQYCHSARRDCGNAGTIEEGTDAAIVSRSESGEDNPQAGPNISILPRPQSSKATKRRRGNTASPRKREKFDAEAIAEVEDALGADEGGQTTLSQYALTAPVVRRLGGLRSRNKRGKVV